MKQRTQSRVRMMHAICVLLATATVLSACGGNEEDPGPAATSAGDSTASTATATASGPCTDPQQIKLPPVVPTAIWSSIILARTGGFEDDACVKSQDAAGTIGSPAAQLAQLASGRLDVSVLNPGQTAQALNQGLDIRVLAPLAYANNDNGIYVPADSPIRTPSDLEDATVGLISLNSSLHAGVADIIKKEGGDPSAVKFSLAQLPETTRLLEAGRLDAAQVSEPFITLAGDKIRPVIRNPFGNRSPLVYAVTTGQKLQEKPEAINGYQQAICGAMKKAAADEAAVREAIVEGELIPASIAGQIRLPAFRNDLDRGAFDETVKSMEDLGFLDEAPDSSNLFHNPEACQQAGSPAAAE